MVQNLTVLIPRRAQSFLWSTKAPHRSNLHIIFLAVAGTLRRCSSSPKPCWRTPSLGQDVPARQVECDLRQKGHVLRRMVLAGAAVILAKDHVHAPMPMGFDQSLVPYRRCKARDRQAGRTDEIAPFHLPRLRPSVTHRFDHANRAALAPQAGTDRSEDMVRHLIAPRLDPDMILVDGFQVDPAAPACHLNSTPPKRLSIRQRRKRRQFLEHPPHAGVTAESKFRTDGAGRCRRQNQPFTCLIELDASYVSRHR